MHTAAISPALSDARRATLLRRIIATMIGVNVMISQISSGARKKAIQRNAAEKCQRNPK